MKISAQFMPGDLPIFLDSVRRAEKAGYARAYLVEGQLLWRDVYIYMTHGLAATERIPFGTAVTNPRTRHFSVIASAHASLAEIYPGRVVLGMGRGDNAVRTIGLKQVSTKQLRETVPKLRELMAGRPVDCDGTEIRIRWANEATGEVPIMVSASGPRTLRMAGAVADIVMIQVGVDPQAVKWAVELVKAGAEEAGRDPDDVQTTLYTAMWVSDDVSEARRMTRWAAACAANHIVDVMRNVPNHGMPPALTRLGELRSDHYDYASHLDPSVERSDYPDEVIDQFAFNGPPHQIVQMLEALADVGLDEVAPCYLNGRIDEMERVGREIIPAVATIAA